MTADDLDTFVTAYIECALWATSFGDDYAAQWRKETGDDFASDTSMESFGFMRDDLADETMVAIIEDCRAFIVSNADDLAKFDAGRCGHDFLLAREGHGAGFWDRGYGQLGERLTDASTPYGPADFYVGDDGKVYCS